MRLSNAVLSFRHPNYRLWFIGQVISLFGTWMQATAQGYFVYALTHSTAYLGYVSFASGIPSWLFMLYGGVVADRFSRRAVLVVTQTAFMVLAFALGFLAFGGAVRPWHIIVLASFTGIVNAFDAPARMSFVTELVPREDLTNAIALNSTMFNIAVALGPAIGGVVYAAFGPAWCFTVNGVSFLAVIAALLRMRFGAVEPVKRGRAALSEIGEGLRFALRNPDIRAIIVLVAAVTFFGFSFLTLIPAWAVDVLHGDATTNGLLQSARGVGALLAAVSIASLGRFSFRGKVLTAGVMVFPVLAFLFSRTLILPLSLLAIAGVGASLIMVYNLCNSLVQTIVEDRLRGRVMAFYNLVFMGTLPIGNLVVGQVAQHVGAAVTVMACAAFTAACAVAIWIAAPRVRALQ
jgi:MFS family permease